MCDRMLIHDRCIAIQFQKEVPLQFEHFFAQHHSAKECLTSPSSQQPLRKSRFSQLQYRSLPRTKTAAENARKKCETSSAEALNLSADHSPRTRISFPLGVETLSPNASPSSGTPTPTNAIPPAPSSSNQIGSPSSNGFNSYQEGFRLFKAWVETNIACVWDYELVKAVTAAHFVGTLVGGFIVIGGTPRVLGSISHAHSRALLKAPHGWYITVLGELKECEISVVQRGQFTPLGDALCWTVHKLTRAGVTADQESIQNSLLVDFPNMAPPEPSLVHATLTDLIHQRKIYHITNRGYGIVTEQTYMPAPAAVSSHIQEKESPPRLLTTSEALTKAHGAAETVIVGGFANAAVQTDLADLLSGIWPNSAILTAKPLEPVSNGFLQRTGSFRGSNSNGLLGTGDRLTGKEKYNVYAGHDLSDVTFKGGDKASVLSKILRVSNPRRRLASFNAQFPPPEWTNNNRHVKHLHSVATQTRSSKHPGGSETCWFTKVQWAPRSSTLPRRPPRPLSSLPAPIDAHFRAQSTSPSPVKVTHGGTTHTIVAFPVKQSHHNISSSSPSPCVTSSHASRNPSPSIYSTTTHVDSHNRSLSPYTDSPTKYKSSPSMSNNDGIYSSPLRLSQVAMSPTRTYKKPPTSASTYYAPPKDPKRKALSMMPKEMEGFDNAIPHRPDIPGHRHENSSYRHGKPSQRHDNSDHSHDNPGHIPENSSHKHDNPGPRHDNPGHRHNNPGHRRDNTCHRPDNPNRSQENSSKVFEDCNQRQENAIPRRESSPRRYEKSKLIETKEVGRSINSSPSKSRGKSKIPHFRINSEEGPSAAEVEGPILRRARSKDVKKEHHANKSQLDQANLQLELPSDVQMNNYRKVVSSPQKPEGLKNNVFSSIAKGSSSDLTSKNMGYSDVNKCDKKLYAEEFQHNSVTELKKDDEDRLVEDPVTPSPEKPSSKQIEERRKLKLSLPLFENEILSEIHAKKLHRKSIISLDNRNESLKDLEKNFTSPHDEIHSVKTYPSLSDLNLTFSSLAAQKILQGVSVNSIDTLVEVNMIAEKRQQTTHNGVTNTDFGFV